ncbi:hypothetical protein [Ferruginibacter albus]|uniref:hypothetical protein n=1 Tax=Ferruginibacter albus TaxID=2875540 RepID=UPI001CC36D29|nr:hypothetical protein [Ferruginibacter albus]UAY52532.1 hypothetical protein K9M53_02300 [Ferruginibacter albus]
METQLANAADALKQVKATKTTVDNATNARKDIFTPIRKLCTRIVNALAGCDVDEGVVENAKTINGKLQGKKASKDETPETPATPDTPVPKKISASQQSFDNLVDHFDKLVELLKQQSNYIPNEVELQTSSLIALSGNFTTANDAVVDAITEWSNAMIERDRRLYAAKTGIIDTVADVKDYVKSVYNATSREYKQLSSIQFKHSN